MTAEELAQLEREILAGNARAISRAATLVDSESEAGRQLMAALFPHTGRARTLGITGPPGSGKSTLVSALTRVLRERGKTVGIIAIDPSSPFSRGAILGDRIRMQDHHADPGVFIRSVASRGKLGGVAQSTLEIALLLDAAGKDFIVIETVGVGQDEVEIARLAAVTAVVLVPGLGDDVQAIKAGIMEIADVFVINKADLPGADRLEQDIRAMQGQAEKAERASAAAVRRTVATEGRGVAELVDTIEALGTERDLRVAQIDTWEYRLCEMLRERMMSLLEAEEIRSHAERVAKRSEDPYSAIEALMSEIVAGAGKS